MAITSSVRKNIAAAILKICLIIGYNIYNEIRSNVWKFSSFLDSFLYQISQKTKSVKKIWFSVKKTPKGLETIFLKIPTNKKNLF